MLGGLVYVAGVTTDKAGNVYALNRIPHAGEVVVFGPTGTRPVRTITFVAPYTDPQFDIALRGRYLYVSYTTGLAGSVDIYNASSSGSQQPLLSVQIAGFNGGAIAVGP